MHIFHYLSFEIKTDSTESLLFAKVNIHKAKNQAKEQNFKHPENFGIGFFLFKRNRTSIVNTTKP